MDIKTAIDLTGLALIALQTAQRVRPRRARRALARKVGAR